MGESPKTVEAKKLIGWVCGYCGHKNIDPDMLMADSLGQMSDIIMCSKCGNDNQVVLKKTGQP